MISISAAAFLSYSLLSKMVERMVSLSVGILLSTSLLHALPEAFESEANIHALFATLLAQRLHHLQQPGILLPRSSRNHPCRRNQQQPSSEPHTRCERVALRRLSDDGARSHYLTP